MESGPHSGCGYRKIIDFGTILEQWQFCWLHDHKLFERLTEYGLDWWQMARHLLVSRATQLMQWHPCVILILWSSSKIMIEIINWRWFLQWGTLFLAIRKLVWTRKNVDIRFQFKKYFASETLTNLLLHAVLYYTFTCSLNYRWNQAKIANKQRKIQCCLRSFPTDDNRSNAAYISANAKSFVFFFFFSFFFTNWEIEQ